MEKIKLSARLLLFSVPPVEVLIINDKEGSVSANKHLDLTCRVTGSRPLPVITWSKNGVVLSGTLTVSASWFPGEQTLIPFPNFKQIIFIR